MYDPLYNKSTLKISVGMDRTYIVCRSSGAAIP